MFTDFEEWSQVFVTINVQYDEHKYKVTMTLICSATTVSVSRLLAWVNIAFGDFFISTVIASGFVLSLVHEIIIVICLVSEAHWDGCNYLVALISSAL